MYTLKYSTLFSQVTYTLRSREYTDIALWRWTWYGSCLLAWWRRRRRWRQCSLGNLPFSLFCHLVSFSLSSSFPCSIFACRHNSPIYSLKLNIRQGVRKQIEFDVLKLAFSPYRIFTLFFFVLFTSHSRIALISVCLGNAVAAVAFSSVNTCHFLGSSFHHLHHHRFIIVLRRFLRAYCLAKVVNIYCNIVKLLAAMPTTSYRYRSPVNMYTHTQPHIALSRRTGVQNRAGRQTTSHHIIRQKEEKLAYDTPIRRNIIFNTCRDFVKSKLYTVYIKYI